MHHSNENMRENLLNCHEKKKKNYIILTNALRDDDCWNMSILVIAFCSQGHYSEMFDQSSYILK